MTIFPGIVLVLSIMGIFNTVYLGYHTVTGRPVKCLFFPREWCEKVQYSKYSRTFGIPNSFAGFGMYTALLVLTLFYIGGAVSFTPIAVIIVIGFLFSL